ncbi:MAG: SusC/RagA family TonB-linked outer membrane protein [Mucilaginibacter sp.]|uniref:SusC/RagA family TonB-linked outer membrane protein n=1 Tax=Mucilaginibacter sp. TaxID=1882438 RepID=UPI003262E251
MKRIFTCMGILIILSTLLVSQTVNAQAVAEKIVIKGKITDAKDKSSIIGATVIEQDNDRRTVTGVSTNIDGDFVIKISSATNKLSISFIGYQTQVLPIDTRRVFNIQLIPSNATALRDVNITAHTQSNNGNLNVDTRDLTTANPTIQAKDLEELQATTIDQALQGRLPGVDIVASSGDPGAGMSIKIRGTSSINGATNPLIVVDGEPLETEVPQDFNFQTADETGYASLLSIAPSDIKDITVLKDAAATAIWGSRASNGVLIITTKRGTVSPPVITYTFQGNVNLQPKAIPLLNGNQYSELIPEMIQNVKGIPLNTLTAKEFEHDPLDPYYYYNYGQNTDWLKAISRTGYNWVNNISIMGGGEKARYFASVGYQTQTGTTLGTGLNRLTTRLNLDYVVSTKIRFKTDISYTHSIVDGNYNINASTSDKNSLATLRSVAQNKMPNQSIYEYDEYGNLTPNYFSPASNIQGQYPGTFNPVALATNGVNNQYGDRIIPHFSIQYQVIPNVFNINADVQFDINTNTTVSFLPQNATGRPITETSVNRAYNYDSDAFSVISKTNFTYTPNIGEKQSFLGLLSIQTQDDKSVSQSALTSNTASVFLQDPSAPSRTQNSELGVASTATEVRSLGALLQGQYKLLDRYIVAFGLRGDANSKFGPNNRYGLFPSLSARWRVSGEPFMKQFKFVNDLSFRASYGVSGNAPRYPYTFYNNYTNYGFTYLGQSGVYSSNIGLDNLRWEKVTGKNLGLNLIMLNNRINLSIDGYRNTTTDLFFDNLGIASFNGFNAVNLNVGTLDNQGFEISLTTTPIKTKDLIMDFTFNIAHNENVIRKISPYVATTSGNGTTNGSFISTLQIDNPLGSFYGYVYKGVYKDASETIATDKNGKPIISPAGTPVQMRFNYPSVDYLFQPGDAKYEDINHDGLIDARDIVYLGNGNPKYTGGFGPSFTYKGNWHFNMFFAYRYGFSLINQTKLVTTDLYSYNNQSTAVLRRWEKPGDVTDIPRALFKSGYNSLGSSRYVEDGSFLRFQSVTVRYNLNQSLAKRLSMKSAGIYLTAQNLYTFTHYLGQDPEISPRAGDIYQQPIDNSTTPSSRSFTLGITAGF